MNSLIGLVILVSLNALAFWRRPVFIRALLIPFNLIWGLNFAGEATIYTNQWIAGIVVAILGVYFLFDLAVEGIRKL